MSVPRDVYEASQEDFRITQVFEQVTWPWCPVLNLLFLVLKVSAVRAEPVHRVDDRAPQAVCKLTLRWCLKILFYVSQNQVLLFSYESIFREIFLQLLFFSGYVSYVRLLTYVPCKAPSYAITSAPFSSPHASDFSAILCTLSGQDQHMLLTDWPGHSGTEMEHTGRFCSGRTLIWVPFPSPETNFNEIHSNLIRC